MDLTPEQFITELKAGKSEFELNRKHSLYIDSKELGKLMSEKYGHTLESATEHLQTDYSNGFTVCKKCGSFYQLGKGFTKHLSNGCLHCEGSANHRVYFVNASLPKDGGFPARWMSQAFDDGLHYCKDKIEANKFLSVIS